MEQVINAVIPQKKRSNAAQGNQNDTLNTATVIDRDYEINKDWMTAEADGSRMKSLNTDLMKMHFRVRAALAQQLE